MLDMFCSDQVFFFAAMDGVPFCGKSDYMMFQRLMVRVRISFCGGAWRVNYLRYSGLSNN